MTLKNLEDKILKQEENNLITVKQEDIDRKILELLVQCIKNNIHIELNENDIIKIANMYYSIFHKYNLNFLKQVIKYSNNEMNMYKILNKLELI